MSPVGTVSSIFFPFLRHQEAEEGYKKSSVPSNLGKLPRHHPLMKDSMSDEGTAEPSGRRTTHQASSLKKPHPETSIARPDVGVERNFVSNSGLVNVCVCVAVCVCVCVCVLKPRSKHRNHSDLCAHYG